MTSYGNGIYRVGQDIEPGVYQSSGYQVSDVDAFWSTEPSPFTQLREIAVSSSTATDALVTYDPFTACILTTDYSFHTYGFEAWNKVFDAPQDFLLRMPDNTWKSLWTADTGLSVRIPPSFLKPVRWACCQVNASNKLGVLLPSGLWQRVLLSNEVGGFSEGDPGLPDPVTGEVPHFPNLWGISLSGWGVLTAHVGDTGPGSVETVTDYPSGALSASWSSVVSYNVFGDVIDLDITRAQLFNVVDLYDIRWMQNHWFPGSSVSLILTVTSRTNGGFSPWNFQIFGAGTSLAYYPDGGSPLPKTLLNIASRPARGGVLATGYGDLAISLSLDAALASGERGFVFEVAPDPFAPVPVVPSSTVLSDTTAGVTVQVQFS
jgi:hypothetical protein